MKTLKKKKLKESDIDSDEFIEPSDSDIEMGTGLLDDVPFDEDDPYPENYPAL